MQKHLLRFLLELKILENRSYCTVYIILSSMSHLEYVFSAILYMHISKIVNNLTVLPDQHI